MATARAGHTATRLPDGRILVAGGRACDQTGSNCMVLASAELYNPATNTWAPAASMTTPRRGHGAVLLTDGRVFAVGGADGATTSAELYDPAANTWTAVPSLTTSYGPPLTLLADGRVLVTGAGSPDAQPQTYNPATNTWTAAGTMIVLRNTHTATLLPNGRVLVAGGRRVFGINCFTRLLAHAEVYDPATNTWTATMAMTGGRSNHTATPLADGRILVSGGSHCTGLNFTGPKPEAELYDPATGAWVPTGSMGNARSSHQAVRLPTGEVLVVGGSSGLGCIRTRPGLPERYDPATGMWLAAAPLGTPDRFDASATLLADGRVLVAGGRRSESPPHTDHASAELYNPATDTLIMGGRGFELVLFTQNVCLRWDPGTVQTGYVVVQLPLDGGPATLLPPAGTIPAAASGQFDDATPPLPSRCYVLLPLGGSGTLGQSDVLCLLSGIRVGDTLTEYTLRLDQSPTATLRWILAGGFTATGLALLAVPLDGGPARVQTLPPDAMSATDATGGVPTCYVLFVETPFGTGNSEALCGIPGLATLRPGTVGERTAQAAAAELRRALDRARIREAVDRFRRCVTDAELRARAAAQVSARRWSACGRPPRVTGR
jgi:hypothetical protein